MDNLVITQVAGNTLFTINYINRNSSTNITTANITIKGIWQLVNKSSQTLSCFVISNSPLTAYTFIAYSYDQGTFSIINTVPSSMVTTSFLASMVVG
jgi:hypothetical protein